MKAGIPKKSLVMLFSFLVLTLMIPVFLSQATFTKVSVSPTDVECGVGGNFAVRVIIADVNDLYGWEFRLQWNPALLDVLSVVEDQFLEAGGNTFFSYKVDSSAGHVVADCTLLGLVSGVSGEGSLATLTFIVKGAGSSSLDLYDSLLLNSLEQPMSFEMTDGEWTDQSSDHDLAIANISPYREILGNFSSTSVEVTIVNRANLEETFALTLFYNSTLVANQTIIMSSSQSMNAVLNHTTPTSCGLYSVIAMANPVRGETETNDNILKYDFIQVSIRGDINADYVVNIIDISKAATAFASSPTHAKWNSNCDMNEDRTINILDISAIAKEFGKQL